MQVSRGFSLLSSFRRLVSIRRFSLRGLLYLSTAAMAGISVGFHLWEFESNVEREIRIYGATPMPDKHGLLEKAYRLAEIGALVDQGDPITGDVPELTQVEYAQLATHFRRHYPMQSLRGRLQHERRGKRRNATTRRSRLRKSTELRLSKMEISNRSVAMKWTGWPVRTEALYMLHSDEVFRFISQEGAGFSRYVNPSINDLELEEIPTVKFDSLPAGWVAELPGPGDLVPTPAVDRAAHEFLTNCDVQVSDYESISQILRDYFDWTRDCNPLLMPTVDRLHELYHANFMSFTQSGRNGYATSIDQAAGFRAHAVPNKPTLRMREPRWTQYYGRDPQGSPIKRPDDRLWRLKSMQLVSLLKDDEPRVYDDSAIPNMERLVGVPLRDLDAFETDAIEQLYQGEDVVIRSHRNRVRMLGSMRTMVQCQTCHATDRGELLGAFTYDFVRVGEPTAMQLVQN